jgi:hypothetical protein
MAAELVDCLAILVAFLRFPGMGGADPLSLRSDSCVRMQHFVRRYTFVPFRHFLGDVQREFVKRLSTSLHGTLGSYLRDTLKEGSVDVAACLLVPQALACGIFPAFSLVVSTSFSCKKYIKFPLPV